jgi:hypothetical protein
LQLLLPPQLHQQEVDFHSVLLHLRRMVPLLLLPPELL